MLDDYRTPQATLVASCALIVRGIMRELLDARATG